MNLFVAGVNYRTAPVELREQLVHSSRALPCQACRLKAAGALDELVLLSTCNRVELYAVGVPPLQNARRLLQLLGSPPEAALERYVYVYEQARAMEHLFKVAAALDSMVLGETEITGQVKQAYEQARAARLTGRLLNQAFQKALHTAKEIRAKTGIGRGATSVGSVAAEVAEQIFGAGLRGHPVLIIGAGQMGEACARHLAKRGAKLLVANRSSSRAQALAQAIGGESVPFKDCVEWLRRVDVVVASTSCPGMLLTEADVQRVLPHRRGRPLFLLDISVPRNIAPAVQQLDNVYLYNIDDLQSIAQQNRCQRERALSHCEQIISRAIAELWPRLSNPPASQVWTPSRSPGWLLPNVATPAPVPV